MTAFEQAQEDVANQKTITPTVNLGSKVVDYFGYQLATHKFNLKLMSLGLSFREIKFSDIKKYYGLKGKTAKLCLPELLVIIETYKKAH